MNSPDLIKHEDFRKRFDVSSNTISSAPIPIDLKILRKSLMKQVYLHFYESEKLWVASYVDQYGRFKHVSCSRTNKRYCRHTNYIRKIQEGTSNECEPEEELIEEAADSNDEGSEAADDENQLDGAGIPQLKCISRKVIGDTFSDEQRAALASQAQGTQRETMRNLHPTKCPDCNEDLSTFYDHTSNYTVVFDISTAHVTPDVKVRLSLSEAGNWEAILQTYAFHLSLPEDRIKRWSNLRNEFQYALRDFVLLRQFDMKHEDVRSSTETPKLNLHLLYKVEQNMGKLRRDGAVLTHTFAFKTGMHITTVIQPEMHTFPKLQTSIQNINNDITLEHNFNSSLLRTKNLNEPNSKH
ncbi:hypothetical protein BKA69DRAFT_1127007 [Paraphysoderma sedebokerense]|nr:hypothetical protein BKA69DRAFT_1127007 [Paraphysoderma sedebokerense]